MAKGCCECLGHHWLSPAGGEQIAEEPGGSRSKPVLHPRDGGGDGCYPWKSKGR